MRGVLHKAEQAARLLDDHVHFCEGGRRTDSTVFDGEHQLLHIERHFVEILEQILFELTTRHLDGENEEMSDHEADRQREQNFKVLVLNLN